MAKHRKSRKDYPDGVLLIADNNGKTIDRYTVLYEPDEYTGYFPVTDMSASPFHPQGVCLHSEIPFRWSVWGTSSRVINYADLNEDCQRVIQQDLENE